MSVIYVLLAISLVVAVIFFIAFIISVKSGQYDDSYTPSVRMLFEDELVKAPSEKKIKKPSSDPDKYQGEQTVDLSNEVRQIAAERKVLCNNNEKIQLEKQV